MSSPWRVSPEGQLLLASVVPEPDPALIGRLLRHPLDWHALVARAVEHNLGPLLYAVLRALPNDVPGPPPNTLVQLRRLYYYYCSRYATIAARLGEIGTALGRAGIPVIALKGAVLASNVYRNPGFRPMRDVDLLVRRDDLPAADRLIRDAGYAPNESWRSAEWYATKHHHLAPLDAVDGSVSVELHHEITKRGSARVPVDELWTRARSIEVGAAHVLALAPADFLLHLCLHLAHDNVFFNGTLRDLRDIAETIRRHGVEVEWSRVVERARAWHIARHVYYALWLARDMGGAEVPAAVLDDLALARSGWLADRLLRPVLRSTMLRPEPGPFRMPSWMMYEAYPLLLDHGGTARTVAGGAQLLARRFRESARQAGPARGALAALYLPVHPFYLAARAFGRGVQRRPPPGDAGPGSPGVRAP